MFSLCFVSCRCADVRAEEITLNVSNQEVLAYKISQNTIGIGTKEPKRPAVNPSYSGALHFQDSYTIDNVNYSVVEFGPYAFYDTKISAVTVPKSVKKICTYAFGLVSSVRVLNFPKVEEIEEDAFYQTVADFTFTESLKMIATRAFRDTDIQNNFDLSKTGIQVIPKECFYATQIEESFILPASLTKIDESAFLYATFEKIIFPASLTTIGSAAFEHSQVKIVDFGASSVTAIPESCFSYCQKLIQVTFNEKIESIGNEAFSSCALIEMIFPSSLKTLGEFCFNENHNLSHVDLSKTKVTVIPPACFQKCQIVQVQLPPNLIEIGPAAFYGSQFDTVTLPKAVEVIGDKCFYSNTQLKSIEFPSSLRTIGQSAFFDNKLRSIVIPEGVKVIETSTFESNGELESAEIHAHTIKDNAFYSCTKLTTLKLVNTVSIGDKAFSFTGITSLELPETVTTLGVRSFEMIGRLTSVKLDQTKIAKIPEYCFLSCFNLENVTFPKIDFKISTGAFQHTGIKDLKLDNNCIYMEQQAFMSSDLKTVDLSTSRIPYIENRTFYNCQKLETLALSDITINIGSEIVSNSNPNIYYCGTSCFAGDCNLNYTILVPKGYKCSKFGSSSIKKVADFPYPVDTHKGQGRSFALGALFVIAVIVVVGAVGFFVFIKFNKHKQLKDEGYLISAADVRSNEDSNLFT